AAPLKPPKHRTGPAEVQILNTLNQTSKPGRILKALGSSVDGDDAAIMPSSEHYSHLAVGHDISGDGNTAIRLSPLLTPRSVLHDQRVAVALCDHHLGHHRETGPRPVVRQAGTTLLRDCNARGAVEAGCAGP